MLTDRRATVLQLISIYGPNEDNPEFFGKIAKIIDNLENKHIIFEGYFNLVLKPELDNSNYLHINYPKAREKVVEIIYEYDLVEINRELNPEELRDTWRKPKPCKQAR